MGKCEQLKSGLKGPLRSESAREYIVFADTLLVLLARCCASLPVSPAFLLRGQRRYFGRIWDTIRGLLKRSIDLDWFPPADPYRDGSPRKPGALTNLSGATQQRLHHGGGHSQPFLNRENLPIDPNKDVRGDASRNRLTTYLFMSAIQVSDELRRYFAGVRSIGGVSRGILRRVSFPRRDSLRPEPL